MDRMEDSFRQRKVPPLSLSRDQEIFSPRGDWRLDRMVLINSPLPQRKKLEKGLNQSPAGASGLVSSQSRKAMRSAAEISRNLARSAR